MCPHVLCPDRHASVRSIGRRQESRVVASGIVRFMFHALGSFVSRHPLFVVLAWVALAVGVDRVAPEWDDVTDEGNLNYLPREMTSVRGDALLSAAFPDVQAKSQFVIVAERRDGPLSDADLHAVAQLAARFDPDTSPLKDELALVDAWSHRTDIVGSKLVSRLGPDGQATFILLRLGREFMETENIEVLSTMRQQLRKARADKDWPDGLELGISGSAAIGGDMLSSAKESIANTEITTVILVVLILLAVYRAPILMIIPMTTIAVSVMIATDVVAWLTQYAAGVDWTSYKTAATTRIFIVVILFGAGTDYCLFLISRYKEELAGGLDAARATPRALYRVGDALAASALTTILGLATMYFADFGKFTYAGPTIALALAIALAACLTLAPALLRLTGRIVFWPLGIGGADPEVHDSRKPSRWGLGAASNRLWRRLADAVLARPGTVLLVASLLMAIPAWQGLSVRMSYNLLNDLQPSRPSVQGTEMLARHFPLGEVSPLTTVVHLPHGELDKDGGERKIALLTKQLYDLPGITAVRSYSEPLGDPPGFTNPFRRRGHKKIIAKRNPRTKAIYLSQVPKYRGEVTRLDLVLESDPFSEESVALLDHVDRTLREVSANPQSDWHGAEFSFVGTTAGRRDLQAVIESDQTLIQRLVVLTVLFVLIAILRRPLVSGYLIVTVVVSYLVTIGITETLFSWYYGPTFDGLDWKVPIFLFVILVAVGQDYNIYLVTRVFEEQRRHGPMDGLKLAMVRTGGIITSCGLIMAGTFSSMMSGTLRGMLELGFALALGVLLDTFFVRPVLVPAFFGWMMRFRQQPEDADTPRKAPKRGLAPVASGARRPTAGKLG